MTEKEWDPGILTSQCQGHPEQGQETDEGQEQGGQQTGKKPDPFLTM